MGAAPSPHAPLSLTHPIDPNPDKPKTMSDFAESCYESGLKDGHEYGEIESMKEGRDLGEKRGRELGAELGEMKGKALVWLHLASIRPDLFKSNALRSINTLNELIDAFPRQNKKEADFVEQLQRIRSEYRKCLSLQHQKVQRAPKAAESLAF